MITNKTTKKVMAEDERICSSIWSKALGLMFQRRVKYPLVFTFSSEQIRSLHMMFVFMPIDVLWLDSHCKVVEMKEGFRPFSFYSPKKAAKFVIELEDSTIRREGIRIGDEIGF